MANLTIALDDHIVSLARQRAMQDGTSVSAQVRIFLERYAQGQDISQASTPADANPLSLPIVSGRGGLLPGIDPCSNKSLLAAADED